MLVGSGTIAADGKAPEEVSDTTGHAENEDRANGNLIASVDLNVKVGHFSLEAFSGFWP